MEKILSCCPVCKEQLVVKVISCPRCNLELSNNFKLSPFDYLPDEDIDFLLCFLRAKGNLKMLQTHLGISYPTAKKRLEQLLNALNLTENENLEVADMVYYQTATNYNASSIIRNKLIESNGKAIIHTYDGTPHEIFLSKDGNAFTCKALPNVPYEFKIFDYIVNLLLREGGRASKGQARGKADKVGSPKCNEHTVTGVIAVEYYGKSEGESVFDPVFILAGILEWADIAKNGWGYLELTDNFRRKATLDV